MEMARPDKYPANPNFSSGPCSKPPGWSPSILESALTGRSHRSAAGRARLQNVIDHVRDLLDVPADYRIGIVPASDTGAVEMSMWSLLGQRPVEVLAWESFGNDWSKDIVEQLRLDARVMSAPYGYLPNLAEVDFDRDVVFAWNGTTSGVRVPDGNFIPADRSGLIICDATSAAFAMDLPWDRLDATTFSWQKVLGGEAAHGMLILSPRAIDRLRTWTPEWPIPKIFCLARGGKLIEGIFSGATINTPSMLCVEDALHALEWASDIGGLPEMIRRADINASIIARFIAERDWVKHLAHDPATRSTTSVCLRICPPGIEESRHALLAKNMTARLERENVAYDIGSYRAAPPGLRIWCGATVEAADIDALMPWIEWAYRVETSSVNRMELNG